MDNLLTACNTDSATAAAAAAPPAVAPHVPAAAVVAAAAAAAAAQSAAHNSSPTSVAPARDEPSKPQPAKTARPRPPAHCAPAAPPPGRISAHSPARARQAVGAHNDRPPPDLSPPRSVVDMQVSPELGDEVPSDGLRDIKCAIPPTLDTKGWRSARKPLQEDCFDASNIDPAAAALRAPGAVAPTPRRPAPPALPGVLTVQDVPGSCAQQLRSNDPAGNSRTSSSSFSAASFSSSLTSNSSLSETEKHFILPGDVHTNCEQLEQEIEAEALSPPPTEMPSFPLEELPDMPPIPANIAQHAPVIEIDTNNKAPSTPEKPDPAANDSPSEAVREVPVRPRRVLPVSSSEFSEELHLFTALKLSQLTDAEVFDNVKQLLDLLDLLTDKIPLPVNERLFTALAEPKILMALVGLIQDTSVPTAPQCTFEALKQFRYPYVVGSILAGPKLADACLAYPALLDKILDILDVPQGIPKPHPVVVAHTVNVLVTYLEYSPDPLLNRLEARPTFLASVVRQLHLGPVVELVSSLLPSRCVDAVGNMDPAAATFDPALEMALQVLAKQQCFHLFSSSFTKASDRAIRAYTREDAMQSTSSESSATSSIEEERNSVYFAEQLAYNSAETFKNIVELTVRVVRIDMRSLACIYLNVFNSPLTSKTVGLILDAGINVYEKTHGKSVNFLITAMSMVMDILKFAEADSLKRVASVAGQPDPLCLEAITKEIMSRLVSFTLIATGRFFDDSSAAQPSPRIRMHVIEFVAMCQRMCSPDIFTMLDKLRFGEVAFKMLILHKKHSMIHSAIVRAVESALLSDHASFESRRHWLVNSRLTEKIIRTWRKERGAERWTHQQEVHRTPFLSTIVHLACCVHHWIACCHANTIPGDRGIARELIGDALMDSFTRFFTDNLSEFVSNEKQTLGGVRPSRSSGRNGGRSSLSLSALRRSGSMQEDNSNPWCSSRTGVHLVRSTSAHRFGFTEPLMPKARSNFADIFDGFEEDNGNDFGLALQHDTFAFIRAAADARSGSVGVPPPESSGCGLTLSRSQSSLLRSPSREMLDTGDPDPFD